MGRFGDAVSAIYIYIFEKNIDRITTFLELKVYGAKRFFSYFYGVKDEMIFWYDLSSPKSPVAESSIAEMASPNRRRRNSVAELS